MAVLSAALLVLPTPSFAAEKQTQDPLVVVNCQTPEVTSSGAGFFATGVPLFSYSLFLRSTQYSKLQKNLSANSEVVRLLQNYIRAQEELIEGRRLLRWAYTEMAAVIRENRLGERVALLKQEAINSHGKPSIDQEKLFAGVNQDARLRYNRATVIRAEYEAKLHSKIGTPVLQRKVLTALERLRLNGYIAVASYQNGGTNALAQARKDLAEYRGRVAASPLQSQPLYKSGVGGLVVGGIFVIVGVGVLFGPQLAQWLEKSGASPEAQEAAFWESNIKCLLESLNQTEPPHVTQEIPMEHRQILNDLQQLDPGGNL